MRQRFKRSSRILSFMLALVTVMGLLPMTAEAAAEAFDLSSENTPVISYSDGATQYFKFKNYLYQVTYTNLKDCSHAGLKYYADRISLYYKTHSPTLMRPATAYLKIHKIENGYYNEFAELPTAQGASLDCYLKIGAMDYAVDTAQPVATVTCMAVNEPTWSWTDTASATATFTAADNADVFATVQASISSETVSEAVNCQTKEQTDYTAAVTFNGQTYTDAKTVVGDAGLHSYVYTKTENNTVMETCSHGCAHHATATLTTYARTYTGYPITDGASVIYSDNWAGSKEHGGITYSNNVEPGKASARVTVEDVELTDTFGINKANISVFDITLTPDGGIYDGSEQKPTVSVVWNGMPLTEDTDYTLSWDKSGFVSADTYTVTLTGTGNFTGALAIKYIIQPLDMEDATVTLDQDTFLYDGQPHRPTALVTHQGIALTAGVDYDLYYMGDDQVRQWAGDKPTKFFGYTSVETIHAGQYYAVAVGKGNYAAGNNFALAKYTIQKAAVPEPTIAGKPYNGAVQTADIADTDLYTVVENNGGTGVKQDGAYDVVLELKDPANYKWSSTEDAQVTLPFAITRAENEWTVIPSVSGWTYGEPANAPVGEAKFGDVFVTYQGESYAESSTAPTEAGSYTATFIVAETEDYKGLETTVDFTVSKAAYDMSGAKWDYRKPILHDGETHSVWFDEASLPDGVTVSNYTGNTASDVGRYTANVSLTYDDKNYHHPDFDTLLVWEIMDPRNPTEQTEKVKDVTAENVTSEDKADLEQAKDDLEQVLEDYSTELTEEETKAVQDEIDRIESALTVIGHAEAAEDLMDKLPEKITKNDKAAVEAADKAYNALTDYERSLVNEEAKKALADAKAALAALSRPVSPGSPVTRDNAKLLLWAVLLLLSGTAILPLIHFGRKRRSEN